MTGLSVMVQRTDDDSDIKSDNKDYEIEEVFPVPLKESPHGCGHYQ